MPSAARRRYDNSRRQAAARATRLKVIEAAKELFVDRGYPATKIEAIAEASDTPLPTLYRLFGSKRALLEAVMDTSFVGDDEPVAFVDRPEVQAALRSTDPDALVDAFAVICRDVHARAGAMYHVLTTAAAVDEEAGALLGEVRRQAHTGRSRIVAALRAMDALDPALTTREAEDIVYACLSFEVARILTVERAWSGAQYEAWVARSLRVVLRPDRRRRTKRPANKER